MSRYSGKCDIYDELSIHGIIDKSDKFVDDAVDRLKKWDLRLGFRGIQIKIKTVKDIVPYFPFVIGTSSTLNGHLFATIGTRSYVDEAAHRHYKMMVDFLADKAKKATAKGLDPIKAMMDSGYLSPIESENEQIIALVGRIAAFGKKADFSTLVPKFWESMREELYKTMLKYGYTEEQSKEWCYNGTKLW